MGSIINRRSHISPHFSNNGISSSSNISFGILPQNTSQPFPGGISFQLGGGPPYFRCPIIENHKKKIIEIENVDENLQSYLL